MRSSRRAVPVALLLLGLHLPGDRWFAPDKVKHFFVSAFIESVSYSMLRAARVDRGRALVAASAATLVVGIGKEVRDAHSGEGFGTRDLVWDAAGTAAAAALLDHAR